MLELIVFGVVASTLVSVVFWLAHDRNKCIRQRRGAPQKRTQARQADLPRKLQNPPIGKGPND